MNRDQLRSLARELKALGVKEAFGYGLSTDLSKEDLEADLQDCIREIHISGRAAEFEKALTKGQAKEAWKELSSTMKALKEDDTTPTKEKITVAEALADPLEPVAAESKKVKESNKTTREKIPEDMTITVVEDKAPKREGTQAWDLFNLYRKFKTVGKFLEKSGWERPRAALAYDRYHGRIVLK